MGLVVKKGGFGEVMLGVSRQTGRGVAIKKLIVGEAPNVLLAVSDIAFAAMNQNIYKVGGGLDILLQSMQVLEEKVITNTKHEIRALHVAQALNHAGLIKFLSAHLKRGRGDEPTEAIIVTEEVDCTCLSKESLSVKLDAIQQLFSAVAALHSAGIIHRDIKPGNMGVEIDNHSQSVLLDFGIAALPFCEDAFLNAFSANYQSPEQLSLHVERPFSSGGLAVSKAVAGFKGPPSDTWAAGITAIEIITKKSFFYCINFNSSVDSSATSPSVSSAFKWQQKVAAWSLLEVEIVMKWLHEKYNLPLDLSKLLTSMLHPDPFKRVTMEEV